MRPARRWTAAAARGLVALVIASCGVPAQESAQPISDDDVPAPLLATTTTTTTTTVPVTVATSAPAASTTAVPTTPATTPTTTLPPPPTQTVGLYFLQGVRLVRVQREVRIADPAAPLEPDVVLDALETGPQPGDPPGLGTALPPDEVVGVDVSRGVATVELLASFRELETGDQELAIAQIVLTLTDGGVGQVAFTIGGATIQVPTAESVQTAGPVTREDYARQLETPDPEPPPTAAPAPVDTTVATTPPVAVSTSA